jgi:PAS domain S-box-containing protein
MSRNGEDGHLMASAGTRKRIALEHHLAVLGGLLAEHEQWLMRRALRYARERGYARYTSTLEEAWRLSIAGLSRSLIEACQRCSFDLELNCDESVTDDPAVLFGVGEAELHRGRGVSLSMFLGLAKYYRQAYVDLVVEQVSDPEQAIMFRRAVDRFFDRLEIGFVSKWGSVDPSERLSELQRINRSLTNEKNLYLTVFESLQTPAVLLDAAGAVENVNEAATRAFGLGEVSGSAYYSGVAVGVEFTPLRGEIADFLVGGLTEHVLERTIQTRTGSRHYLVSMKRMTDVSGKFAGATLVLSDLTARKRAEENADENWELYRRLFESMPIGFASHLMVYGEDGEAVDYVFLEVNDSFERMTGLTRDDVIGRRITEITPGIGEDEFDWIAAYARVVREQESASFEQYSARLDRWYEVVAFPFGENGFVTVFADVTGVRNRAEELERAVEQATHELAETNHKLRLASEAKSAFIANMSHELRTPLNSIIGFSGIMLQGLAGELSDEQQRQVTMIGNSGRHLLELVNEILDIARIEAGRVTLRRSEFDPCDVLDEVLELVRPMAADRDLVMRADTPGCNVMMLSDPDRLHQILMNLLSNAVKYTPQGEIVVRVTAEGERVRFSVCDTGSGIAADDLPHLFATFVRTRNSELEGFEGAGLGLSIAQKLAELLGGRIEVESEIGVGSTFTLDLPLEAPEVG